MPWAARLRWSIRISWPPRSSAWLVCAAQVARAASSQALVFPGAHIHVSVNASHATDFQTYLFQREVQSPMPY